MFVKKERLGVYFWNNIFISKWMGLYPGGGLKLEGALTWDFTVCYYLQSNKQILQTDLLTFRYRIGYERI